MRQARLSDTKNPFKALYVLHLFRCGLGAAAGLDGLAQGPGAADSISRQMREIANQVRAHKKPLGLGEVSRQQKAVIAPRLASRTSSSCNL
jgi:hypothetical protein